MSKTSKEYYDEFSKLSNKNKKMRLELINLLTKLNKLYPEALTIIDNTKYISRLMNKSTLNQVDNYYLCDMLKMYESYTKRESKQLELFT